MIETPSPLRQACVAHKRCTRCRQVVQTAVIVVVVLLIFRSLAAEPYHVPTGSMWPALAGNHRAVHCPRCGYKVVVGRHRGDRGRPRDSQRYYGAAACPNCGCNDLGLENVPECPGDHLLVNKLVFDVRRPRRWEMVVFRCPADPGKAFVKRAVGLPGETIEVKGGDIYINGELARKTLDEVNAVRVPVFDNDFQPAGVGFRDRWDLHPSAEGASPAQGKTLRADGAKTTGRDRFLVYRHFSIDDKQSQPIRDEYAYNCGEPLASVPVHDFMMEFDILAERGEGRVSFGITDGQDRVRVEVPVGANPRRGEEARLLECPMPISGESGWASGNRPRVHARAPAMRLMPGRRYHVEVAFVDRRVSVRIDGAYPFAPADFPPAIQRSPVTRPVALGARGVVAVVTGFRLYRDIHYTEAGTNAVRNVVTLGPGEYFVLGDNSPNSDDSRFWPNRGVVAERLLIGKPFLAHLPSQVATWTGSGKTRRQHMAADWGRIRWLR